MVIPADLKPIPLVERELRTWIPPGFTRAMFRGLVESFKLAAPVQLADLAELRDEIKARVPAGYAIDVMMRSKGHEVYEERRVLEAPAVEVAVYGDERLATEWIAVPT